MNIFGEMLFTIVKHIANIIHIDYINIILLIYLLVGLLHIKTFKNWKKADNDDKFWAKSWIVALSLLIIAIVLHIKSL